MTPCLESLNTPSGISTAELESTVRQLIVGAADTAATNLTSSTYYLLSHPAALSRLVNEIRTAFPTNSSITKDTVATLPYLNAVLNECLRILPPLPGNMRRIAPREGCYISGHFIPGNTIVCYDLYAGGRSSSLFARPHEFLPERYLADCPDEFKDDKRKAYQPFSVGPRNCLGKNLAYIEMRMVLAK